MKHETFLRVTRVLPLPPGYVRINVELFFQTVDSDPDPNLIFFRAGIDDISEEFLSYLAKFSPTTWTWEESCKYIRRFATPPYLSLESYKDDLISCETLLDVQTQSLCMVYIARLILHYVVILQRLHNKLTYATCTFSVYPNSRRPLCKTMPWDILPSLVILWGVCWMFYTPPITPVVDRYQDLREQGLPIAYYGQSPRSHHRRTLI
jgi:hypothetical protein